MLQLSEQVLLVIDINTQDLLKDLEACHLDSDVTVSAEHNHERDHAYLF